MKRSVFLRRLLLVLLLVTVSWWAWETFGPAHEPFQIERPAAPITAGDDGFAVITSRPGPSLAESASGELLEQARRHLEGDGREGRCGEYAYLGDVTDAVLLGSCARIGTSLDEVYRERFGVEPLGEPAATILLFEDAADYRAFASEQGMAGAGYAGYSRATRGYAALWADADRRRDFARTLAHELTHLVHRRALGGNLPRWLSEGLADAVGDTATEEGIGPLQGLTGVEGQADRLRRGIEAGQVEGVARLVTLEDEAFDRGAPSYDYEQSALLVRYLLVDLELAGGFRGFLTDLAAGEDSSPERLRRHLGIEWMELDRRFEAWLRDVAAASS